MRRNPAHCSNAFGPSRGTFSSALRLRNGPAASRRATIAPASPSLMPDTRASSGTDAVFTFTPTAFTQSSTTASSERDSFISDRSCWYWPTPMDFGSILTSSASGSCRRRAMDTAPRRDTSMPGSSREAYSDAEYTEAPASETMILVSFSSGWACISSAASRSVSREAVPLPIAMSSTWWAAASRARTAIDAAQPPPGRCGPPAARCLSSCG